MGIAAHRSTLLYSLLFNLETFEFCGIHRFNSEKQEKPAMRNLRS